MNKKHIGRDFDEFLQDEGILAESEAEAIKRVIAWQIKEYMEDRGIKKNAFAAELKTSRSQLDRLLDPTNTSINLKTLAHAAEVMGKHIELRIAEE